MVRRSMGSSSVKFARRPVPDLRDKDFPYRRKPTQLQQRYWRDTLWFGDQEESPDCVGYCCVHWLVNNPVSRWLDPRGLYIMARHIDEADRGTSDHIGVCLRSGLKAMHQLGLICEYRWISNVSDLANAVLTTGPVMLGTTWYSDMMEADSRGYLQVSGKHEGGHAWLINGVSLPKREFRLKQSWGRHWGLGGRAKIRFDDMAMLFDADVEVCTATARYGLPT